MAMTDDELKAKLEAACEDLWWSSESDYPVKPVWREESADADAPIATAAVRQMFDYASEVDVEVVDIEDFFERATAPKSWHTDEDKAQRDRLQQLKTFLTESLIHLQVYRCGEVEISVYVLGYTGGSTGDRHIAGVKTILVET